MHIGLNAQLFSGERSYRQAGISRYIQNLIFHLARREDPHTYTIFGGGGGLPRSGSKVRHYPTPVIWGANPGLRILWEQALQPWEAHRAGVELLHSLAYVLPLGAKPCPMVVTVHDLSFLRFPECFSAAKRWYLASFTRPSVRRADAVIAVSGCTKNDLVELMGVPQEKVAVVYSGVDEDFRPASDMEMVAFRQRQGLEEGYILFLGTLEPRKNLDRLLEAYSLLRKRGLEAKLVIAGPQGWLMGKLEEALARLELTKEVLLPGFIAQDELYLWYSGARLFVYPSLYEGFGLPVLEAMACGTPVVASSGGALPEVVGEAGLICDPYSVEGLAVAIERVLEDWELRGELVAKGLARAGLFRWGETAANTVAVYEKVRPGGD